MFKIRKLNRLPDEKALSGFDASFSTKHIYRVVRKGMSFELIEETLDELFTKSYALGEIKKDIDEADFAVAAEVEPGVIGGLATVKYEAWNRRAVLSGIFVAPNARRKGVGKSLINAAFEYAKSTPARCLWVETQNVNYPAVQFYTRLGFTLCGLDTSLYDSAKVSTEEAALFFVYTFPSDAGDE